MRKHHEAPEAKRIDAVSQFPLSLCVWAILSLMLLSYQLLLDIPEQVARGKLQETGALSSVVIWSGSSPILTVLLLVALLAPGFLNAERSREYFLMVTLVTLSLWAILFVTTGEPARRLGVAIHDLLATERPLPNAFND